MSKKGSPRKRKPVKTVPKAAIGESKPQAINPIVSIVMRLRSELGNIVSVSKDQSDLVSNLQVWEAETRKVLGEIFQLSYQQRINSIRGQRQPLPKKENKTKGGN